MLMRPSWAELGPSEEIKTKEGRPHQASPSPSLERQKYNRIGDILNNTQKVGVVVL